MRLKKPHAATTLRGEHSKLLPDAPGLLRYLLPRNQHAMSTYATQLTAHYQRNREFKQAVCLAAAKDQATLDLLKVPETERAELITKAPAHLNQKSVNAFYQAAFNQPWFEKLEQNLAAVFEVLNPKGLLEICTSVGVTHQQIKDLIEREPARRVSLAQDVSKLTQIEDRYGVIAYRNRTQRKPGNEDLVIPHSQNLTCQKIQPFSSAASPANSGGAQNRAVVPHSGTITSYTPHCAGPSIGDTGPRISKPWNPSASDKPDSWCSKPPPSPSWTKIP